MARQTILSEADWMEQGNPEVAWNTLRVELNERQQRLLACACCRRVLSLLDDPVAVAALDAAERFADGDGAPDIVAAMHRYHRGPQDGVAAIWAAEALSVLLRGYFSPSARNLSEAVARAARADRDAHGDMDWRAARRRQVGYLCDLRGRHFYSVDFDPLWGNWHDGLVVVMAQMIFEKRRFSEMPVLADALEDAGCDNADIPAHCRSTREHVRGCWVIDELMGKV
jgi:hypothetical protein